MSDTARLNPLPANILLLLIATLLAPMFLGVCGGDIHLARAAALETINDYRIQNRTGLIPVAQIIACGLAGLGSLCLSMADDLSVSMTLRLRNNANALDRTAERNHRRLNGDRTNAVRGPEPRDDDPAYSEEALLATLATVRKQAAETNARLRAEDKAVAAAQKAAAAATVLSKPTPAAKSAPAPAAMPAPVAVAPIAPGPVASTPITPALTPAVMPAPPRAAAANPLLSADEQRSRAMWANSMLLVAGECTAGLATLPPYQREAASVRAAALTSTAHALLSGNPLPATPSLTIPRPDARPAAMR
jgi:hypothetical protein